MLPVGVSMSGVVHTDRDVFDIDTRFRMAREAGVFDFVSRTPPPGEIDTYLRASEKYAMPMRVGIFFYMLGRDEPLLDWHLRVSAYVGAKALNVQILTHDVTGRIVPDEEIVTTCLWAAERGEQVGVTPCFEVHVGMWSEHYGRVSRVAEAVERRGVPFNMTLDHSHVIFKIDNPNEQAVQNMKADIDAGLLELDPACPGDVCSEWIARNYVRHAHARAAVPANPVNIWARHPNGSFGRGIQYPFIEPGPGEWHSAWKEDRLDPWKLVILRLLRHHANTPESRLGEITTEFIPMTDYGAGAKYSIFANNIACAEWIRKSWSEVCDALKSKQTANDGLGTGV
jgi:hypothetical protein